MSKTIKHYGTLGATSSLLQKALDISQPLNLYEIWSYNSTFEGKTGKAALEEFAKNDTSYIGEKVAYIDEYNNVTHYYITHDGNLKELGVVPKAANKSITVDKGAISISGFDGASKGYIPMVKEVEITVDGQKTIEKQLEWTELAKATVQGDGDTRYTLLSYREKLEGETDDNATGQLLGVRLQAYDIKGNKLNIQTLDLTENFYTKRELYNKTEIDTLDTNLSTRMKSIEDKFGKDGETDGTNISTGIYGKIDTAKKTLTGQISTLNDEINNHINDFNAFGGVVSTNLTNITNRLNSEIEDIDTQLTDLKDGYIFTSTMLGNITTLHQENSAKLDTIEPKVNENSNSIIDLNKNVELIHDEIGSKKSVNADGDIVDSTGIYKLIDLEALARETKDSTLESDIETIRINIRDNYLTAAEVQTQIHNSSTGHFKVISAIDEVVDDDFVYLIKEDANSDIYTKYIFDRNNGRAIKIGTTETSLVGYVKQDDLNSRLSTYYDSTTVENKLRAYATPTDISTAILNHAYDMEIAIHSALENYTTKERLTAELNAIAATYETKLNVAETLKNYDTSTIVTNKINDAKSNIESNINATLNNTYLKKEDAAGTYVTSTTVDETITRKLNSYIKTVDAQAYADNKYSTLKEYTDTNFVLKSNFGVIPSTSEATTVIGYIDEKMSKIYDMVSDEQTATNDQVLSQLNSYKADTDAKIATNVSDIDSLEVRMTSAENAINSGITNIEATTPINNGAVLEITKNGTNYAIAVNAYTKAEVDSKFQSRDTDITELEAATDTLTNNVNILSGTVESQVEEIGEAVADINRIISQLGNMGAKTVAERLNDVEAVAGTINGISSTVGQHSEAIGTNYSEIQSLKTTVSGHTSSISDISADLSTAINNIDAYESRMDAAETLIYEDHQIMTGLVGLVGNWDNAGGTVCGEINRLDKQLNGNHDATDHNEEIGVAGMALENQTQINIWAGGDNKTREYKVPKIVYTTIDGKTTTSFQYVKDDQGNDTNEILYETEYKKDSEVSIRQIVNSELSEMIDNAPAALDTLKEIADWIESDTTGTAAMSAAISANATKLGNHEVFVAGTDIAAEEDKDGNVIKEKQENVLGHVKSSDEADEIKVSAAGVMSVNEIRVRNLSQEKQLKKDSEGNEIAGQYEYNTLDILVLDGGGAFGWRGIIPSDQIQFSIYNIKNGITQTYLAEKGMTFREWGKTNYNTSGLGCINVEPNDGSYRGEPSDGDHINGFGLLVYDNGTTGDGSGYEDTTGNIASFYYVLAHSMDGDLFESYQISPRESGVDCDEEITANKTYYLRDYP